jgi:nucleotide-binding universal stress UspA family protein
MNEAVVVGYDQSRSADRTLAEAARAAVQRGAQLVILNAYPRPVPSGATLPLPPTEAWAPMDLVESANEMVGAGVALVRSWYPELRIEGRVVPGLAWDVLDEASNDAALLVVGSHGGGGVSDAMLGSVTSRVLADSACPVLVVPTRRHADGGPVVAAADIDEPCDDVLDFAFAEAGRRRAMLEVLHVWEQPWTLHHLRHTEGSGRDVALIEKQLQLRLAGRLRDVGERHPGVEPVERIRAGSPAKILTEAAHSAGLIVIGARCGGRGQRHRQ